MSTIKTIILLLLLIGIRSATASPFINETKKDTVIIELENDTKIIIYTMDKTEFRNLQAYNINEMIRDLNSAMQSEGIDQMELEIEDGKKYRVDKPTVIFGDTIVLNDTAFDNIRIRVGGLELKVKPDKIDNFDKKDIDELRKYSYVKKPSDKSRSFFNIDIGTCNWLRNGDLPSITDANYSVRPWGSWYLGMNWLNDSQISGPLHFEWGGGVSWYNWKLENPNIQIIKDNSDGMVAFVDSDSEMIKGIKSKLSATYLNLSFVPVFDFGRGKRKIRGIIGDGFSLKSSRRTGFRFGAGIYVNYRIGSKTKFRLEKDTGNDRIKEKDHFYLSNFRYGIRGQIGIRSFDMFVLYDINDVFMKGRGPNGVGLNAFVFGIIF